MSVEGHDRLDALVAAEAEAAAPGELQQLVRTILHAHGDSVSAILFYGSCRRTADLSGLIDLYVLYDQHRAFHGKTIPALLNWLLPPNVMLMAPDGGTPGLQAKVAVLSERQFHRRVQRDSLDTTIWTRFSQPASLLYARDPATFHRVVACLAEAIRTAVFWARVLNPGAQTPADHWRGLFAHTYRAELRPERRDQPDRLYRSNARWFDAALAAIPMQPAKPCIPAGGWVLRRLIGKPLNLLRLLKAAFTFSGGVDYILWKLQRHSGIRLTLTAWQRRHPVLAAPWLLWRIRRLGGLR